MNILRQRVNTQVFGHITCGNKCIQYVEEMMLSEARLKKFEMEKPKHTFYINIHSQNIFPKCHSKIPCVFPVWKK